MYGNRFVENDETKSCLNFAITIFRDLCTSKSCLNFAIFREFHACLCKDKPKTMIRIPNDILFYTL